MVLGSEGRLGIITEATVHVHRLPVRRTILGYLFPTWAAGLAAMQEIAASEATPSVTRVSDAPETAFSFATQQGPDAARPRQVARAAGVPAAAARLRPRGDVPRVHRLRGRRSATSRRSASWSGRSSRATAASRSAAGRARSTTRRSSTRPTSATICSTAARWPTCRRPSAPWSVLPALYDSVIGAARGAFRDARHARLHHVPPVALVPLGRVPVLHVRGRADRGRRRAGAVRRRRSRRSSRRSWTPAPRSRTTTPSAPSTRAGSSRTSPRRGSRCCARCSTASTRGRNLNPGKIA